MLHQSKPVVVALLALSVVLVSSTSHAGTIYTVNRTIGDGTVAGYIETDGTLGVLSAGNIIDWLLTLTAPNLLGGSPDVIGASGPFTFVNGSSLTATPTQLLFDFGGDGLFFLQQNSPEPRNFWCLEAVGAAGDCAGTGAGEIIGFSDIYPSDSFTVAAQFVPYSTGVLAIATAVPEPATLLLLGTGLGAVAARRRLKKRA